MPDRHSHVRRCISLMFAIDLRVKNKNLSKTKILYFLLSMIVLISFIVNFFRCHCPIKQGTSGWLHRFIEWRSIFTLWWFIYGLGYVCFILTCLSKKYPNYNSYIRKRLCVSVCICPSVHNVGPISMKLGMGFGPWEWHGVGKVVFTSCLKLILRHRGKKKFAFMCVSEHFESKKAFFFFKIFCERKERCAVE